MSNSDILIKNMISNEIENELVKNIALDFNKLDKNIENSLNNQLLDLFGYKKKRKKIKQKALIQEYSILK
mgnify:CR=1 FL=1